MAHHKPCSTTTAVLYLRVSTQEQATEGISLAAQDAKLRAYCTLRGLDIVRVIVEGGVSGGKPLADRDGGQELLTLVRRAGARWRTWSRTRLIACSVIVPTVSP
jgi:DNA invertase Pin-like site-specific DNA recombinase